MPCRLKWATTLENYRMTTIDATLRGALEVSGRDLILTLDPALQGLPETAHGGSVLAVFDALADASLSARLSRSCGHASIRPRPSCSPILPAVSSSMVVSRPWPRIPTTPRPVGWMGV